MTRTPLRRGVLLWESSVLLPLWTSTALAASPVNLDRVTPDLEVLLDDAVLAESAPDPVVPISDGWRAVRTVAGVRTWEVPLPARTRTLFFHRPPKGMELLERPIGTESWDTATALSHRQGGDARAQTWTFDTHSLQVRRLASAGPPPPGTLGLRFETGIEREAALRAPEADPTEFVVRSLQLDDTTRHGLYLVPGAATRHTLELPAEAHLRFGAVSIPPEAADPAVARNGQEVVVRLTAADGSTTELRTVSPPEGLLRHVDIDLSPWQNQVVTLSFQAPPDGTDHHDAVFVADPVVVSPDPAPPRIVVVFIDTLRQDALSLYGNDRPTSPGIDAWARDATVFTQARSVAPWTLPTARSLFSGRAPELWGQVPDLPAILRDHGWASAFIAGNIYLSSNFDMANHWTVHRCINWPIAEVQVDRARRWLDEQHDRPAFLVLHFMDMHLPYTEPEPFRSMFAGPAPAPFPEGEFHRNQIVQWERDLEDSDREWLVGRYHNNLAYIDSVLTPFLNSLPENTTVLLLSDHGEEFWDHGDFEHGHSLYDELLRVPLVASGPGFSAGTVDAPTSLLDVAPTILRAAGIDTPLDGLALQDVATADPNTLADRPIAFGRPLYGRRRWGVVRGHHKYTTWKSTETLVDLSADPEEADNLLPRSADAAEWRQHLSEALRTPVYLAYTLYPQQSSRAPETRVSVSVPGGVRAAWAAEDPTLMSEVTVELGQERADLTWLADHRGTREAYVVPVDDPLLRLLDTTFQVEAADETEFLPVPDEVPDMTGRNRVLGRARVGGRSVSLYLSVVPLPPEESVGIRGFDAEVEAELEALGYIDH